MPVRQCGESCIIAAVDGADESGHRLQSTRHPNAVATRDGNQTKGMDMSADIDPRRLVFPGLAGLYRLGAPYSYAFMRFATGAVLVPHGIQKVLAFQVGRYTETIAAKGLPFPELLAYLTFFTESVAAICLAIGLFTRVAAVMIWIEMLVIVFLFQWQYGYFWTNRGYEYALLWLLLCTAIFFRGGGRYSVDRLIGKEI
jgi:putative oxidoreductase